MGAFQIWHIEFKNQEDRDRFEKLMRLRRLFQYKTETYDCMYYIGWEGYGEGREFLEKNKTLAKNIIKFESLDLSTQSAWYDELKNK